MEELIELLPRKLLAAVLIPFVLGVVALALLVEPTATGRAFVFLLFAGGICLLVLLGIGLSLLVSQSRGLDKQREPGG